MRMFFSLVMVAVSSMSFPIFAETQMRIRKAVIDGIEWKYHIEGNYAFITSGDSNVPVIPATTKGKIQIPSRIDDFQVNKIAPFAFVGCNKITQVFFPREMYYVNLERGLFSGCKSLQKVVFPHDIWASSSNKKEEQPFFDCTFLKEVVFLEGVPRSSSMDNLGIDLDGKLRFTAPYRKQWKVYVEDNDISGWEIFDPDSEVSSDFDSFEIDMSLAEYHPLDEFEFIKIKDMSSQFTTELNKCDADYEKLCENLLKQRDLYIVDLKHKCQDSGDLNGVVACEMILNSNEKDDESLKIRDTDYHLDKLDEICEKYNEKVANCEQERNQKQAQLAMKFIAYLEREIANETKKGNIEYAKELSKYLNQVSPLCDTLLHRVVLQQSTMNTPDSNIDADIQVSVIPKTEAEAMKIVTPIKKKGQAVNVSLEVKLTGYSGNTNYGTKMRRYVAIVRNSTQQASNFTLKWYFIGRTYSSNNDKVIESGVEEISVDAGNSTSQNIDSEATKLRGIVVQLLQNGDIVRTYSSLPAWQHRSWITNFEDTL